MSTRAFEIGDRVQVVGDVFRSGPEESRRAIGTVRSVDKQRRRTEPYYIYFVELPGETKLIDFEYRELELVSAESN